MSTVHTSLPADLTPEPGSFHQNHKVVLVVVMVVVKYLDWTWQHRQDLQHCTHNSLCQNYADWPSIAGPQIEFELITTILGVFIEESNNKCIV